MNTIFLFLLKGLFVSGILTVWYFLGLRNRRLHNYNRGYLLFSLLASVIVPLLHFQWFTVRPEKVPFMHSMPLLHSIEGPVTETSQTETSISASAPAWDIIALYAIAAVSLILLSALLIRVMKLLMMARSYPFERIAGVKVIHTTLSEAPFSFFNYLFWKDTILLKSETGRIIFRHERTHIQQRHTYDKLACRIFTCVCWFNPFYWIIQKELSTVHEFIADSNAIDDNDTDTFARMLLQSHDNGSYLLPEHRFFSSPVKRRLTMLQTNKYTSYASLRRFAIIPLTVVAVLIFSFTTTGGDSLAVLSGSSDRSIIPAEKRIVLVVDAGHGGTDIGCKKGSLVEKEITLAIANRIKELSPQYNVEVHLTRNSDKTLSLADRVGISNKINPDGFISIHIGDDPKANITQQVLNLGVAIDTVNKNAERSQHLGLMVYINVFESLIRDTKNIPDNNKWYTKESPYVCRKNTAPGILLELGDIKNTAHMRLLADAAQRDNICHAILEGVVHAHKM